MVFSSIRKLQESINRIGLGGATLRLAAPRMLSLPAPDTDENNVHEKFLLVVDEPDIVAVARDLFVSGFYAQAVEAAYKVLDSSVREASNVDLTGTKLMEKVFSPNAPIIFLNRLSDQNERNEQSGYQRLFAGSMLGIRNPCAHAHDWIDEPETALETIVLCQHLMKKLRSAVQIASSLQPTSI